MFGINHWELLIVAAIFLLLFGGSRIPGIARSLGRSITEFKKGTQGIEDDSQNAEQKSDKPESSKTSRP